MSEEHFRQAMSSEAEVAFRRLKAAIAIRAAGRPPTGTEADGAGTAGWPGVDLDGLERLHWPFLPAAPTEIERKDRYRLADFLHFHDEDFICNAYRGILRREPDSSGFAKFLDALRTGRLAKSEILGRMRYSAEGRALGVHVAGLAPAFALRLARRIPALGRLLGIAQYLLRLPDIVRNHERLEAVVFQHRQEFIRQSNYAGTSAERAFAELQEKVVRISEAGRGRFAQLRREMFSVERGAGLESSIAAQAGQLAELAEFLTTLDAAKADRDVLDARLQSGFAAADAQVAELRQIVVGLAERKAEQAALDQVFHRIDQADAHAQRLQSELAELRGKADDAMRGVLAQERLLETIYVPFEDRFRGSREEIRARTAVYLPLIAEVVAGTAAFSVLDVGCGRGEWLELLGQAGVKARGVDSNVAMVARCRELGLDVVEGDALAYLRTLADGSLGAVSAMHVVEHIPFVRMIMLLDEILRVLRPGGIVVLETPNPENLIVGACNFHFDPTHKFPIPPATLQFTAETRGFASVSVMRLHPYPESEMLADGPESMRRRLNDLLFGPQDYAIVGYKPVVAAAQANSSTQ